MSAVDRLADELLDVIFDQNPVFATITGMRERDHLLGGHSEDFRAGLVARYTGILDRARALPADGLSAQDAVTRAVVVHNAQSALDQIDVRFEDFTVTDDFIAPYAELLTAIPMAVCQTPEQTRAYLTRLGEIPRILDELGERNVAAVADGLLPVAHLVQGAIDYIERYLADTEGDVLRRPVTDEAFAAELDRVLAEVVHPAYAKYRALLVDEVLPHGRPEDRAGLCWLPEGERRYAKLARLHTTTDHDPRELHRVGLDLIAKLAEEYKEIGSRLWGTTDLAEIFSRMRTDPEMRWRDADEMLTAARTAVAKAQAAAPQWFTVQPESPCEVREVPAAEAPASPAAYYMSPSLDGSRPGIYFLNTYQASERFRFGCEALAFHEAVPGHHFQIAISQELTDLPMLRRVSVVTAYAEGWGLYTERLADEMGLYSDDVMRLGMLSMDSMRAARLVVDTGVHALGWSRQQVIDYLTENTPMPAVEIESETDRYISYPGQALAYMVGRLEILRLRAEAERKLGDRFDIRAFHDVVLSGGSLPLSVLSEVVAAWAAELG
ncbi:DUF885 domain-containing protein [Allokutzneria sp. A3M-2-11 16]|uniref:DUF885 domain-containing protein n=1 Tax=Allokutzneria sp. A3M-2-11 16 TaxID=2962043 RepID=UPI0020B79679|nr:DUF885 domain-containing protein [Allokutzneria sp. A3M-2-11 16]MCP3802465.1 DUF885 domain-containing protein [Allokutzneria sp. A3M-2-11 16]